MPITPTNPFKGRQFPGEVILLGVRWYLRYPLSYEHVAELLGDRGVEVDASCIWRWVQAYAPEINKRCRPHLGSLVQQRLAAVATTLVSSQIVRDLLLDHCFLHAGKQILGLGEREADFLQPVCVPFEAGDVVNFFARVGFHNDLHPALHMHFT